MSERVFDVASESDMLQLGAALAEEWQTGDCVLLVGDLGAGKTTLVRGVLQSLGVVEGVRSPTFNLMQIFDTQPPVMHADLYRLDNAMGIGMEEFFADHLCLIEWPDRAEGLVDPDQCIVVRIDFAGSGRRVTVSR